MSELLTVPQIRERLPMTISERTLRQKLRNFGTIIEHRNQILLEERFWEKFLESLRCSNSSSAKGRRSGKSMGRALTPESAYDLARAQIAKAKRKTS